MVKKKPIKFIINLLIQISNIIYKNIKSKVLKTLKDNATSRLIAKIIDSRSTHLIILKMLRMPKIPNLQYNDEHDLI